MKKNKVRLYSVSYKKKGVLLAGYTLIAKNKEDARKLFRNIPEHKGKVIEEISFLRWITL